MFSGTSSSAPFVSGISGLLKSANPFLNNEQIVEIINESVDVLPSLNGLIKTSGRVNARKALEIAVAVSDGFSLFELDKKEAMDGEEIAFSINLRDRYNNKLIKEKGLTI